MRVLVALGLLAAVQGAAVLRNFEQELVENQWIVVFHDNVTEEMRADHMLKLGKTPVIAEYKHSIKGYAIASTPEDEVFKLSEDPMIKYIEQDGIARASNCENLNRNNHWGLRRVSSPARGGTDLRRSRNAGQGVDVYIIDTGIYVQHSDFAGRAEHVFDCTGQGAGDGNGHGTHCASTAAGNGHGIASDAKLFAVKVLNAGGSGTWACVTQGIDFVAGRTGQRVGSMSLGGGRQQAVNDATDAAVARGAAMISASGNSNANACNFSPASARNGLTVNSMQDNDARSGFSNWGTCTHIFAPGTNILGAWIGNPTATRTISGTSMACPHVAGIVAEVWSQNSGLTAVQVQNQVVQQGARDIITNPGNGSPNILAQTSCAA